MAPLPRSGFVHESAMQSFMRRGGNTFIDMARERGFDHLEVFDYRAILGRSRLVCHGCLPVETLRPITCNAQSRGLPGSHSIF